MSEENYKDGLILSVAICATVFVAFGLFLLFGGRTMDYDGLSRPLDTSVIKETTPVQLYVEGLE